MKPYLVSFTILALCGISGAVSAADLPGRPPGVHFPPAKFLPGEDQDNLMDAPAVQGALTAVGDATRPNVPNAVYFDFGTISIGRTELIRHDFTLHNSGDKTLTIAKVEPGCGCTATSADNGSPGALRPIEPGKDLTVHVSVDPKQLYVGTINKMVMIYFPGSKFPAFVIHMVGHTIPTATFEPDTLDFGDVRADSRPSATVTVNADTSVYGPTPPDPHSANGRVTVVRDATPPVMHGTMMARTYKIQFPTGAHLGLVDDAVEMPARGVSQDAAPRVVITGHLTGGISATPGTIVFEFTKLGKPVSQQVTLTAPSPGALQGLSVKSADHSVAARITKTKSGTAVVQLTFAPTVKGPLRSSITISDGSGEKLDLPVMGWADQ